MASRLGPWPLALPAACRFIDLSSELPAHAVVYQPDNTGVHPRGYQVSNWVTGLSERGPQDVMPTWDAHMPALHDYAPLIEGRKPTGADAARVTAASAASAGRLAGMPSMTTWACRLMSLIRPPLADLLLSTGSCRKD